MGLTVSTKSIAIAIFRSETCICFLPKIVCHNLSQSVETEIEHVGQHCADRHFNLLLFLLLSLLLLDWLFFCNGSVLFFCNGLNQHTLCHANSQQI